MLVHPHLLRTFVTVAECGSFSAAAARLGYTQSAVSQHIAALESDLGTPLLGRRPVVPTPAGERLLEHAGALLLRLDAARADVRRTIAGPPSTLTLAASPLAAQSLARALAEVRRSHPGTEHALTVCGRTQVVAGVAAGTFTLGLTDGIAAPTDPLHLSDAVRLRTTPVAHDELVVALPTDHPLAKRRGLTLDDLVDARWIDAPDLAAPLAALRTAAGSNALHPAFTYHGTDLRSLLTLIEAGHGLAILPRAAVTPNAALTPNPALTPTPVLTPSPAVAPGSATLQGLAAVPLTRPRLVHRTELLHGHLSDPAAEALASALSDLE